VKFFQSPGIIFFKHMGNCCSPSPPAHSYIAVCPVYVDLFSTFGDKRLPEGYQDVARTHHTIFKDITDVADMHSNPSWFW